jgi:hypothetical protein
MATWLLVQLAALAVAAFRIPLAAAYPQPAELQAVQILLVVQFAWVSILFPALLKSWAMAWVAAASAWVLLILAAALAAWPMSQVVPVAVFLSLWILILATLGAALPWRWQLIASAVATTWILGGPLLEYLRNDVGSPLQVGTNVAWSPLMSALATPHALPRAAWWGEVGIELLICGVIACRRVIRTRHVHFSARQD